MVKSSFKNTENVRISVLKHATRDRSELKKWSETLLGELGINYTSKVIGWTIVLRKWRKGKDMRIK